MPPLIYDRSKVDLTNCDREPIHIPGSIQPHGAMIILDSRSNAVSFVSDNLPTFLGDTNRDYKGAALSELLGGKVAHDIANASASAGAGHVSGIVLNAELGERRSRADITVHRYEGRTFVELETPGTAADAEVALHLTQSLVRRIDGQTEIDPLMKSVARLIRAMLGYDRVMVYRFLHNGAGRVVAEARDASLSSFLGQHFPFSDIPVQARRLYVQNWIRVIGDISFTPVPLVPALEHGEAPVDLSHAHLRSVSPIHCQYLANMGVAASMSISIVVDGELWGLIACHHNTPKSLSIPLRVATELFAQYFSLHVTAIQHRQEKIETSKTRSRLDAIIAGVDPEVPVTTSLARRLREVSSLIACDGIGLWSNGEWTAFGLTPVLDEMEVLIPVIAEKAGRNIWETQDLRSLTGQSDVYGDRVAGMLVIPISVSSSEYLVFFRSEEAHEIEWAGEPIKHTADNDPQGRLTPRGSFEAWREDVRHKSMPWETFDLAVAETIRSYVRDVMLSHNDATEEQREKTESQRNLLNAELNHRVKNILALVKSIASQTGANAESVAEYTDSFEGRLRALSYAHDQSFGGSDGGELRGLIDAEAAMHRFSRTPDRISLDGPSVGLSERSFGVFALLLHEMMTNAAKYGSLSSPDGHLHVEWRITADGDCHLAWIESGGPVVVEPTRKGFGSTLIEKTIAYDLGGTVDLAFDPAGVRASFIIPARHLHAVSPSAFPDNEQKAVPEQPIAGMSVLLVEDQALIAMDTEERLIALGAAGVRTAADTVSALAMILGMSPDCAVLDLNLGEETSDVVAAELDRLGVPYFATGYRDSVSIPERFASVPVVRKPVSQDALASALGAALATKTSAASQPNEG